MNDVKVNVFLIVCPQSGYVFGVERNLTDACRLRTEHPGAQMLLQQMLEADIPKPEAKPQTIPPTSCLRLRLGTA